MIIGPFGINPLYFSLSLFGTLLLFVVYLLLPRGFRVRYFNGYPKRYVWSAKPRRRRNANQSSGAGTASSMLYGNRSNVQALGSTPSGSYSSASYNRGGNNGNGGGGGGGGGYSNNGSNNPNQRGEEMVDFQNDTSGHNGGYSHHSHSHSHPHSQSHSQSHHSHSQQSRQGSNISSNDEAIISSAMAQLRNPGVLIVAHGSRGKPKTVRLQLTDTAITWRTETRKKNSAGQHTSEIKLGKLHSVSLTNIMYVDVGKQTTALRRVENASVPESLCFSLLTKEGSLDLEANSPRERDALISCFSLVLDEVHAQNWRDIYRGPSNDMPSSFDEYDEDGGGIGGVSGVGGGGGGGKM